MSSALPVKSVQSLQVCSGIGCCIPLFFLIRHKGKGLARGILQSCEFQRLNSRRETGTDSDMSEQLRQQRHYRVSASNMELWQQLLQLLLLLLPQMFGWHGDSRCRHED